MTTPRPQITPPQRHRPKPKEPQGKRIDPGPPPPLARHGLIPVYDQNKKSGSVAATFGCLAEIYALKFARVNER